METLEQILNSDSSLSDIPRWRAIEKAMSDDFLYGFTSKVEIGTYDLYLKTTWYEGKIIKVDITMSRGHDEMEDFPKSVRMAELENTRYDLAVRSVASACRDASSLLQSGVVGIGFVLREWAAIEGYPSGWCPQIKDEYNPACGATFVSGPLDAAAKLIRQRLPQWTEWMKILEEDKEDDGVEVDG